ncbi:MAG TPA: HEAT repeat domain-containing protein, partial [Minicystis sp.]|nr:HEAT repeat domain-containing protein [Minicystis sp.]
MTGPPRSERPPLGDDGSAALRRSMPPGGALEAPEHVLTLAPPGPDTPTGGLFGVPMTRLEARRTALLFVLLFLVAFVFVVGRTARDALFLTQFPASYIGPMWMAYGGASSLVALGYARYVDRLPRVRFVVTLSVIAAVAFLVLRVLIGAEVRAAYAVLYVVAEIVGNLMGMAAWTLAQDLHDARSAKRLFGLIGAGRVVGVVVSGLGTAAVVRHIGTANLLFVLAAGALAFGAVAVAIGRRYPLATPRTDPVLVQTEKVAVAGSPYVMSIALMTLALFAMLTIGDYQFKAIAQSAFPARDELARYMANFYGAIGAFGFLMQVAVTPRLLQRYGVLAGMLAMPLAFSASTLGLVLAPGLVMASVLKASDNGLQYSIHDATTQLLLFPFSVRARSRVRTIVDAVFKPVGCAVGAAGLLFLAPIGSSTGPGPELVARAAHLGIYTLPVGLAVVAIVPLVRAGYVEAMRRTLVRREIEPVVVANSPHARAMLRQALASTDAPQVLFAAECLRGSDDDALRASLERLARHRSRRVRALAIRLACELDDPRAATFARRGLRDGSEIVRVAGVEALAAGLREDAHDELVALADGEDVPVRAAAIAALVRSCGLDGMLDGAPRLRELIESTDAEERVTAARVLGMVGEASLQRALARLLADAAPDVRRAAVDAAWKVGDVRLLPELVAALADKKLAASASRALGALGPG